MTYNKRCANCSAVIADTAYVRVGSQVVATADDTPKWCGDCARRFPAEFERFALRMLTRPKDADAGCESDRYDPV